jgi:hypothetical protein
MMTLHPTGFDLLATLSWGPEDDQWIANTLSVIGPICLIYGLVFIALNLGITLQRRSVGNKDRTFPPVLLKWCLASFIVLLLVVVVSSLTFSDVSPLSRGNKAGRLHQAAVTAFMEGHYEEAESFGRAALQLAEQTEEPQGEPVRLLLGLLRNTCLRQTKLDEAEAFQQKLIRILKASPATKDEDLAAAISCLSGIRSAREESAGDIPEMIEKMRSLLDQLPPEDRRGIEQLARELQHLERRLTTRTGIEKLEADPVFDGKPFGSLNEQWESLKGTMIDGDELWHWSTSPQTWAAGCGRRGIALVRDGNVVAALITELN